MILISLICEACFFEVLAVHAAMVCRILKAQTASTRSPSKLLQKANSLEAIVETRLAALNWMRFRVLISASFPRNCREKDPPRRPECWARDDGMSFWITLRGMALLKFKQNQVTRVL